jgi:hypothetical protein
MVQAVQSAVDLARAGKETEKVNEMVGVIQAALIGYECLKTSVLTERIRKRIFKKQEFLIDQVYKDFQEDVKSQEVKQ